MIYQGKEADLEDEAAVENLLTPMFEEIHQRRNPQMKYTRQYLFPELEPTAIMLASLVGQLETVEAEKKAVNDDYKERIDLLKLQIKSAAKTINEGMAAPAKGGEAPMLGSAMAAEPEKLRSVGGKESGHPELS